MEVGKYGDAKLLLPHVSVTAFTSDSTSKPAPRKQGYRRCQPPSYLFVIVTLLRSKNEKIRFVFDNLIQSQNEQQDPGPVIWQQTPWKIRPVDYLPISTKLTRIQCLYPTSNSMVSVFRFGNSLWSWMLSLILLADVYWVCSSTGQWARVLDCWMTNSICRVWVLILPTLEL